MNGINCANSEHACFESEINNWNRQKEDNMLSLNVNITALGT